MTKYSFAFKFKAVETYLSGLGRYRYLVKQCGVKSKAQTYRWVNSYSEKGIRYYNND
ncbi:transposase [Vagococcus fessus]|uniref:transposase n=1 Tax=Vagococcus fessus TaxID=120370 RepID=UPI000F86FD9C|nr:transposase [Vagococcus fessus]